MNNIKWNCRAGPVTN